MKVAAQQERAKVGSRNHNDLLVRGSGTGRKTVSLRAILRCVEAPVVLSARRRVRPRRLPLVLVVTLTAGLLPFVGVQAPASAAAEPGPAGVSVEARPLPVVPDGPDPDDAAGVGSALPAAQWPQAGGAVFDLGATRRMTADLPDLGLSVAPVDASSPGMSALTAGEGPVGSVRVDSFDHSAAAAAGAAGHVFTLSRADGISSAGAVQVSIDYSGYASAFGGSFADRLQLVRLPACALTTPQVPECTANPEVLPASNDVQASVLTAVAEASGDEQVGTVQRSGMLADEGTVAEGTGSVLAVMAASTGGSTGDYKATDLKPADEWSVGLSSGGFSYSYPLPTPPLPYGSAMNLALGYSSSGVDGVTSTTNNQGGWAGLGWSMSPGYIERTYYSCSKDYPSDSSIAGEMCWESPDKHDGETGTNDILATQMTISLNGQATKLVKTTTGQWRTKDDFGWKIENLVGGAENDGYWLVSTPDGSRYRFGYTRDAVWKLNVMGDDAGEPCNGSFPGSCRDPWRWNLDRIEDRNKNLTELFWTRETNYYKRAKTGSILEYDRGGYLDRIEYGRHALQPAAGQVASVDFTSVGRCVERTQQEDVVADPGPSCPSISSSPSSYPDVPADLICGSSSCGNYSQAFFSTVRLDYVTTYTVNNAGNIENNQRLQLRFKFIDPPGLTGHVLFLDYVRPIGLIGADADKKLLPVVNFDATDSVLMPTLLDGRVDYDEAGLGVSAMRMPRIVQIHNGLGGRIDVHYGRQDPCPDGGSNQAGFNSWHAGKVGNWDINTEDCYPLHHSPGDEGTPGFGIFHKYLVKKVVYKDNVTSDDGSPDMVTQYDYSRSKATWAHPRQWFVDDADESWNDWRGYRTVRVLTGSGTDPSQYTVAVHTFFQGMYHDRLDTGALRQWTVTDYAGNVWDDPHALTGKTLQTRQYQMATYNANPAAATYTEVGSSRYVYDYPAMGDGPGYANPHRVQTKAQFSRTGLTGHILFGGADGWRQTEKHWYYDGTYGRVFTAYDRGDVAVADDDTCTTTGYTQRDDAAYYLINFPTTVTTYWGTEIKNMPGCMDIVGQPSVKAKTHTVYDRSDEQGYEFKFGNATKVVTTGAPDYTTKAEYDGFGRVTSTTDAADKTTTTVYSPAVGWPINGMTTTNPLQHTTTTYPWQWVGSPSKIVDANGKITELAYDHLGRLSSVHLPGQSNGIGPGPTMRFEYQITYDGATGQPTAPARITSETIRGALPHQAFYLPSYVYLDGMGRTRETQAPAPVAIGGRIVTTTTYDARGNTAGTGEPIHNSADAGSGMVNAALNTLQAWHKTTYDHLSRPTQVADYSADPNVSQPWRTTATEYTGDRIITTPPKGGGGVTIAHVNAAGNTEKLEQYKYDPHGQQIVLPLPPPVTTAYKYDPLGRMEKMTDHNGNIWTYTHDPAGRKRAVSDPDAGNTTTEYDGTNRIDYTLSPAGKISNKYDDLSRITERWSSDRDTGTLLASYTFDPAGAKGQLASATRHTDGTTYTTTVNSYDERYRPSSTTTTIPEAGGLNAGIAGSYTTTSTYNLLGSLATTTLPAAGDLPAETLTYSYDGNGYPTTMTGTTTAGSATYVAASDYYNYGPLRSIILGNLGSQVKLLDDISQHTGRLTASHLQIQDSNGAFQQRHSLAYGYSDGGNITSIIATDRDEQGTPATRAECFDYDRLLRLTKAWTEATTCTTPQRGGTHDPYWRTWTFDDIGNRQNQTDKNPASGDTVWTYTAPASGENPARPHSLTSVSATGPLAVEAPLRTFDYDSAGNTTRRQTEDGISQTLSWDVEGHLKTITQDGVTTTYVYDADGNRIAARSPNKRTLYLEHFELTINSGIGSATRYYTAGGKIVAARSASGVVWNYADHHGTPLVEVDSSTLVARLNRSLPFGEPGVTQSSTVGSRGFVGGIKDGASLVRLGAREYDPSLGRFLSVDPVMDLTDPQQWNAYAYSNNSPVTFSDPTGLAYCAVCDGTSAGGNTPPPPPPPAPTYIKIGDGVIIDSGDPNAAWLQKAYTEYSSSWANCPFGLCTEYKIWASICGGIASPGGSRCPAALNEKLFCLGCDLLALDGEGAFDGGPLLLRSANTLAEPGSARSLWDPASMRGATLSEVMALAEAAGLESAQVPASRATGGWGVRYFDPKDKSVQIVLEAGLHSMKDPVHQGFYMKWQVAGAGKAGAVRVPLAGNPNPTSGFTGPAPTAISAFGLRVPPVARSPIARIFTKLR